MMAGAVASYPSIRTRANALAEAWPRWVVVGSRLTYNQGPHSHREHSVHSSRLQHACP